MTTAYIGIDPGKKGGIACYIPDTGYVDVEPIPLTGKLVDCSKLADILADFALHKHTNVWIEQVHAMPKQGVTSMFNFGRTLGRIEGVALAMELCVEYVRPQKWKANVLDGTDKSKDAAIEFVSAKFPQLNLIPQGCRKPHDGLADALCIAVYGSRQ